LARSRHGLWEKHIARTVRRLRDEWSRWNSPTALPSL
jgi:hypothetical protein